MAIFPAKMTGHCRFCSQLPFFQVEPIIKSQSKSDFFQFAVESAADEVFLMKSNSEIVYVNESACRKLEYTHEELIGKCVWQWDPLFPKEVWPGFWEEFSNKKHLHFETQHQTKNGRVYPVEIHAHYYKNDDNEFLLAFVNDITEKKLIQDKLEDKVNEKTKELIVSKQEIERLNVRLNQVIENAEVGVWTWDVVTNDNYWSEMFYQLLGFQNRKFIPFLPNRGTSGSSKRIFF